MMILLRLSGHSGAGKTRLVNALTRYGITCPKVIRYTSRERREGEAEGEDYHFRSREFIESLPEKDFLVGPVRNMLQAFDLDQITKDLKNNDLLLIEIYPALWERLADQLYERLGNNLKTASVFMTAVDPAVIRQLPDENARSEYIRDKVYRFLLTRGKDSPEDIKIRANAAPEEILAALNPQGVKAYSRIIFSAPEGPDGEDDWTKESLPVGQAKAAMEEFITFYNSF